MHNNYAWHWQALQPFEVRQTLDNGDNNNDVTMF